MSEEEAITLYWKIPLEAQTFVLAWSNNKKEVTEWLKTQESILLEIRKNSLCSSKGATNQKVFRII